MRHVNDVPMTPDIFEEAIKECLISWYYHALKLTKSKSGHTILAGLEQIKRINEITILFDIDIDNRWDYRELRDHYGHFTGDSKDYSKRVNEINEWITNHLTSMLDKGCKLDHIKKLIKNNSNSGRYGLDQSIHQEIEDRSNYGVMETGDPPYED